jgi:polyisoprenoid-binding protein YceI
MAREIWDIDSSHSSVGFTVRHMVFAKVHGRFAKFAGTIELDREKPERSSVAVTIDAKSIDTHDEKRDAHLRSPDFFDVEQAPELSFRSTGVRPGKGASFQVVGDLTIRGVTRPVTLEAESLGEGKDPWGNARTGFTARASINRLDYGLKWNQVLEAGGVLVADRVDLELDVEAVRRAG